MTLRVKQERQQRQKVPHRTSHLIDRCLAGIPRSLNALDGTMKPPAVALALNVCTMLTKEQLTKEQAAERRVHGQRLMGSLVQQSMQPRLGYCKTQIAQARRQQAFLASWHPGCSCVNPKPHGEKKAETSGASNRTCDKQDAAERHFPGAVFTLCVLWLFGVFFFLVGPPVKKTESVFARCR